MRNTIRPVSPLTIDSLVSSPRSGQSASLASSQTSLSRDSVDSPKSYACAAFLDDEPEDILVLAHPPEGTHLVETPAGPVLRPVTWSERVLRQINACTRSVSHIVTLWVTAFNEAMSTLRRIICDKILRLDPLPKELRPLRDNLAVHGYPIKDLQEALRETSETLGPLANRVDYGWVQSIVEKRLIANFALEPALLPARAGTATNGLHDFRRALQHITMLATSPSLCSASRDWQGWRTSSDSFASWAGSFAALSLLSEEQQQLLFAQVPVDYSLADGVLFVQALTGGPSGAFCERNALRLAAFLAPAGDAIRDRLRALLKLSPDERWQYLSERRQLANDLDPSLAMAVEHNAHVREVRLFEKVLKGLSSASLRTEAEAVAALDRFVAPAHSRRPAWLLRLARLPVEMRADLIFAQPPRAQSMLALEKLATEYEYAQRLGGTFEVDAE